MLEPEKEKLQNPEKVLEPEKEKKGTRKRRVWTQDMIEEGLRYLDESDPESIEDGCLLLGLTRDRIDLD